jgi:hypothetical protein
MSFLRTFVAFTTLIAMAPPATAQTGSGTADAQPHHETSSTTPLLPAREASGTAWTPDLTPMFGVHREMKGWTTMVHGLAFGQFLYESGAEHHGARQAGSINWMMLRARRAVGRGRFGVRLMASAEPWTIPGCGYPNLVATGETCDGDTIHDRQHPHDLFMELAVDYERPLSAAVAWQVYAGASGEPALGPPGFPHRLSAFGNPSAPIAHHWLDSTHITYGVVTTGLATHRWKGEMSLFNGREPDEQRADLDLGPLDSIAGRLVFSPTNQLTLQLSAAHLEESEAELVGSRTDVRRVTASATYHRPFGLHGLAATTIAYGFNAGDSSVSTGVVDERTHAGLVETSVSVHGRHTWFGRAEIVGKPAHDLHAHEFGARVFTVGKLQGGYIRHFGARMGIVPGIGGTVSATVVPELLAPRYEGRVAPGAGVFLLLTPRVHD